jgi:tetratricopeptide (TPR) repeat protein
MLFHSDWPGILENSEQDQPRFRRRHGFCFPSCEYFFVMLSRIILGLAILVLFSACKSSEDYLSEGRDLSAMGNFKAALNAFAKAIQGNPFLKDAYIQLGACHESLHQEDSALYVYKELIDLYPENTAAIYYSGICKYRQGKFTEAIAFFNRAIDSKGGFNTRDTTSIQALIDLNKDNFDGETTDADIPTREIIYDRGMAYYKSGQIKNACCDFASCIFQKYNPGPSHYMISLCRLTQKIKYHSFSKVE